MRGYKDGEMFELKLGVSRFSSHFTVETNSRRTITPPPLHLPTHPSVQTIPLLSNGRWDVVRLHSRMTLSCCVGQTGNEEDCRWRQVAIQSEAAVSVSIKLLHLAWPAR